MGGILMKISNNWMECDVVPKFYGGKGYDITVRVTDDAPEEAKKCAEVIRKGIADGKFDKDLDALYKAMMFKISREGL